MNYSDYKLKGNPFRIGPPLNPEEIIWAGFKELKEKLEIQISTSIKTSPSRIVLNWGRYGSGKTHAANYFTRTKRVDEIAATLATTSTRNVKVNLPRTSKDPVQAFLRSFLGQINLQAIKIDFDKLIQLTNKTQVLEMIQSVSSDGVISELLKQIIEADTPEKLTQLESYLFGDSTKGTLNKLGLPSGLKDDEQIVNFLSAYINTITYNKKLYSAFFLWIDEFEDIDTLNKNGQDRFTTFLRQLFDKTPNNLALFLNFTPKTFFNIEDLSITLGEALATRAKLRVMFEEPSIDDAKEYIIQLINDPLNREASPSSPSQPFEDDVIGYILKHIGRLSVRQINEVFSLILELALLKTADKINEEFVQSVKSEIISWEEKQ